MSAKQLVRNSSLPIISNSIIYDEKPLKIRVKNFKLSYNEIQQLYRNIMSPLNKLNNANNNNKEIKKNRTLPAGIRTSLNSNEITFKKSVFSPYSQSSKANRSYLENISLLNYNNSNRINSNNASVQDNETTNRSVFFHNAKIYQKIKPKTFYKKSKPMTTKQFFFNMKKQIDKEKRVVQNLQYYIYKVIDADPLNEQNIIKRQRDKSCGDYSYYPSV